MERWSIMREDTEYQTPIFTLFKRWTANPETGREAPFYVIKCPDWVNVIAVTVEGDLLLVEQYRHGIDDLSLEIPGGVIDAGETPLQAALRELEEETGYTAAHIEPIGGTTANAAIMNNRTHTFLATGCRLTKPQCLDEHEQIRVIRMPKEDVFKAVLDGRIHHSIVVAALGMWAMRG